MTTCAGLTDALDVDPAGTASAIASFVLLETPGPWGEDVRERAFRRALGTAGWTRLERLWQCAQLRPLVVRRPGRATGGEPVLLVGSTRAGWLEQLPASGLPALDLEALADGVPGHGTPVDGPVFAVCTNGSVDRCCAVRGRPLAAALHAAHPERTWEVSHVGGCRFAANLLVLPTGAMHGRLTPADGLAVADAALRGRTALTGLRGRTGTGTYPATAEVALRRHLRLSAPGDVELVREDPHSDLVPGDDGPEPAGADVVLRARGDLWRVGVRTRALGVRTSACDGTEPLATTVVTALTRS